jgi:hypothetical protein
MQKQETLILFGVNTVIVVIVLFILFKMQDTKIKMYLKKLEKKLLRPPMIPEYDQNMMLQMQPMLLNQQNQQNQHDMMQQMQQMQHMQPTQPTQPTQISENDSYIDPIDENES